MCKTVAFVSLCQCLEVEKTLKFLFEEKEQTIRSFFSCLVGDLVWNVIKDSFCIDFHYDDCIDFYDDDIYLTFNCENRYVKDVEKKLEEVFGTSFSYDYGDNYSEFKIGANYILNMR